MKKGGAVLEDNRRDITLRQCEAIIQEGLDAMYKADRALSIIHDMSLYSQKYKDFEAYCEDKWDIGQKHQYVFIQGKSRKPALLLPQNNIIRRKYESNK